MKFNFNSLKSSAGRILNEVGFQAKKHSPEILVVSGTVGMVVSTIMACKATTKVDDILEDTKETVEKIHRVREAGGGKTMTENGQLEDVLYTPEEAKKDLTIVYVQTGVKFLKLYGPSLLIGAASITSILVGYNILHKRNLALAAAYTAVDTGFKKYRGRVVERFGETVDRELQYGVKAEEVEETIIDENGKEVTEKKTVVTSDPLASMTPYTFCFDETADGWQRDAEANKFFLLRQQDYANELLRTYKRLFLNDVLKMVGIPPCKAGQVVGWIYDEDNAIGDNYIDFGMFNINDEASRNFMNGLEKSIWLTFNVDGDILYSL